MSAAVSGKVIVSDVDLEIARGSRVALVGTNGAGKSTLLRAISGITRPAAGAVLLDGEDIHAMPGRQRARKIAFVGQEEHPPAELRLDEMVALGRIPNRAPWELGASDDHRIVRESLSVVGLLDRIDDTCDRLSGGERRRAVLARGLAQGCSVLMLDEPTNHLDIRWQIKLLELIAAYEGTVVAAMHDLDLVLRHFDAVAVLHAGKVWAFGAPHEVFTPELLAETFAVTTCQIRHPSRDQSHLLIDGRKDDFDE
ncbi:ABC transporter ATP-binding protein [Gephyromycinifex aptenodytis]|uniref:ABC transporter ATP-binding protein n=1 Tax=Gephyromycinifex aptenodytis TaxID=2716227 RepID=UPI001B2FF97C|nr:ABC transporter ATP-binding protein [Gephyromycinifex aptenodytis]